MHGTGMDTDEGFSVVYQQLADLETKIVASELEALRRREFTLKPLYEQRKTLTDRLPKFWAQVLSHPLEEVQEHLLDPDLHILASLRSFSIERYQIESETHGDPRSLRFTFEFGENEYFQDTKLVKEFRYKVNENGAEGFVSSPVLIQWKKKQDVTHGVLAAAVELYKAEEALKGNKADLELDSTERESLWQYEKLRKKLHDAEDEPVSFFNWFGYRGLVSGMAKTANDEKTQKKDPDASDEDEEDEENEDKILDVEIFPRGEEVANALAEDLWPNVMDYYMAAQMDSDDETEGHDGNEDSDEAPGLVSLEELDDEKRPGKRRRLD